MGKAALFVVLSFSVAGATLLYTVRESDVKTSLHQSEYDADVLAREIARSAYNAAVGDVNRRGRDLAGALTAVGTLVTSGCANGVVTCYRRTGQMQGGRFVVEASQTGGNAIDIYTAGYYPYSTTNAAGRRVRAEKVHTINEYHPVSILEVDPRGAGGKLKIQFIDSQAGYCSAILLQRTIPGLPADRQPGVEMVYAPGNNRNGDRNVGYEVDLAPGTQLNFGIGVDTNCGTGGSRPTSRPDLRKDAASALLRQGPQVLAAAMDSYRFLTSDWSHVHWALDAQLLGEGRTVEGPWAMVEVDPANPQRWRIAFEDQPLWNLAPTHSQYNNPNQSLAATKRFGYDWQGNFRNPGSDGVGNGWTDVRRYQITLNGNGNGNGNGSTNGCNGNGNCYGHGQSYTVAEVDGPDGFHDLRDTGSPADFSDQVIFVEVIPPQTAASTH